MGIHIHKKDGFYIETNPWHSRGFIVFGDDKSSGLLNLQRTASVIFLIHEAPQTKDSHTYYNGINEHKDCMEYIYLPQTLRKILPKLIWYGQICEPVAEITV